MLTPTHLAGAYLVLSSTRSYYEAPSTSTATQDRSRRFPWLLAIGLAVSVAVDVDGYFVSPNHHASLLHYPVFWVGLFLILNVVGLLAHSMQIRGLGVVLLISGLTHLFFDTFGLSIGIFWLWPFSTNEMSFWPLMPRQYPDSAQLQFYLSQPRIFIEVAIVLLGLVKLMDDRRRSISTQTQKLADGKH